jgi:hypothetical protein
MLQPVEGEGRWSELRDAEKVAARIAFVARTNHWNEAQLLYTDEWRDAVSGAVRGDGDGLEAVLVFLEADPICVWSGFEQQDLFRLLATLELDEPVQARLRAVVLRRLRSPRARSRTMLKALARISAAIATPTFDAELRALPRSANPVLWRHEQCFLDQIGTRPGDA